MYSPLFFLTTTYSPFIMAFLPGLKKQFNKANQFMSERITGVEGTKLDPEFAEMERRADLFNELVEDLQVKTKEYLQPNPTVRAKMAAVKGISKLSGQAKASTYPQPEGTLGDAMCTYGKKLNDFDAGSVFAMSLIETGESLKQMADLKYALDDGVKQNFLEPLHHTQSKDLREVMHHRKKLQGRKLDFDCKKRTGARDDEVRQAEDKFAESLHLAQLGMHNLMEGSGVEHISQLTQFAESFLISTSPGGSQASTPTHGNNGDAWNPRPSPKPSPASTPTRHSQPSCQALYDFEAENPGELSFKEGDMIMLKTQIDDNWVLSSLRIWIKCKEIGDVLASQKNKK
eukprot:TCALIF_00460-PA protein Name:"Similar to endoA Endophilin-A (Drosophila pseudoobscura pseudoobscura)" AED:0.17 eAED:0.18 QI:0/0/0/0.5/1/1/4/0/343